MDNPLTPKKIQRLMYLAEDKSFNASRFGGHREEASGVQSSLAQSSVPEKSHQYESSSGILDLEQCESLSNLSLSKSSAFQPAEMTGRSTGADEPRHLATTHTEFGRYSVNSIESLTKKMKQQSSDIKEIMRQSIASAYSFHSKRDLTADEMSLVMREAPLPVHPNQINTNLAESVVNESNSVEMSIGSYFQTRCSEFNNMLPHNDSPKYDASYQANDDESECVESNPADMDSSLDSIPVKQSRKSTKITNVTTILSFPPSQTPVPPPKAEPKAFNLMPPPQSKAKTNLETKVGTNNPIMMKSSVLLDPSKQHLYASLRQVSEESNRSEDCEASLSISKIANILGNDSNVSVTQMLNHIRGKKRVEKQPLSEININNDENKKNIVFDPPVTLLKDSKKCETASSAGTVNTIIDLSKMNIFNQENIRQLPAVVISRSSISKDGYVMDVESKNDRTRSKSPSSKSQTTLCTVQENFTSNSFKSTDSPRHQNQGEAKSSNVPSPNIQYKELDKSVDWQEVLQSRARYKEGLAKGQKQWVEISVNPIEGYVGVSMPVVISLRSLTDSWLTAKFTFEDVPDHGRDIIIDLPRSPLLITPEKTETFHAQITCNKETKINLPFTVVLKDTAIEDEVTMTSSVPVNVKMPTLQAVSSAGVNKVVFPPVVEGTFATRTFMLISDCSVDLQLELSITEGSSMFNINSVQEISKADITKKLLDCQEKIARPKSKGLHKQLCKLSSNNAMRVSVTFSAPNLSELHLAEKSATFNGSLNVGLIGVNSLLKKVELIATAGTATLRVNLPSKPLHLSSNEMVKIPVSNVGTVRGSWAVRFQNIPTTDDSFPFSLYSNILELEAGTTANTEVIYTGPLDKMAKATIVFEGINGSDIVSLDITAGSDVPKVFPIKTNYATMSWVRAGRKEISLKNCTDKRVYVRCRIVGDGFSIDLPRTVAQNFFMTFGPHECRPMPILFNPNSVLPCAAVFYMVYENGTEITRKVLLHGCASGEPLRWSGLMTFGDIALVRAAPRRDVELTLVNRSAAPAFIAASVQFSLQYKCVGESSYLVSPCRVISARGLTTLKLHIDWNKVERLARCASDSALGSALATITVLTGAESLRRRILRVLNSDSAGSPSASSLSASLQQLAGTFDNEDPAYDKLLKDFQENKSCLEVLVKGLVEMKAQVELCQDLAEDRTVLITDETVIDHHTLCD